MNILQAQPDRLNARFAVALASEEAAQRRDLAQHFVQPWLRRRHLVSQQVGSLNFVRIEEQISIQVGAGSAQPHQMRDAPRHHHEQRQGAFQLRNRTKLQCFDPAGILQDVKQDLYFPARAIPVDQLDYSLRRAGLAVDQQTPFDRFGLGWCTDLARDEAGRSYPRALGF